MDDSIHTIFAEVLERTAHRDSLMGKIAEWVGIAIIEGRLHPGDELNSVALSNRFQTSRTPVREALMILQKEGLVTIPPRRRPHAAPDEALEALRAQQARLEEAASASDMDSYFWRNLSFQATEAAICGNAQLRRLLDSLGLRTLQARHHSLTYPGRIEQSVRDHARLVHAL